jgi:hypothetical protein
MASMETVATFYEPAEALAAAACLRAHGFIAVLPEYHHATLAWSHVFALQGVRLWTLDTMANEARSLLGTTEPQAAPAPAGSFGRTPLGLSARPAELLIAIAAFTITGLPLPLWRRRAGRNL